MILGEVAAVAMKFGGKAVSAHGPGGMATTGTAWAGTEPDPTKGVASWLEDRGFRVRFEMVEDRGRR